VVSHIGHESILNFIFFSRSFATDLRNYANDITWKKFHGATTRIPFLHPYFVFDEESSFSTETINSLCEGVSSSLRRAWNIARGGRNIQFREDNKAATLSMSISEMGWATFRDGSSLHDENEVKRRKPRWLSARPPMPRSPSFSSEFNKNPRASGIELATRRRSSGSTGKHYAFRLSSRCIALRFYFASLSLAYFFCPFCASLLQFSRLSTSVEDVSSVSSNFHTNCVAELGSTEEIEVFVT